MSGRLKALIPCVALLLSLGGASVYWFGRPDLPLVFPADGGEWFEDATDAAGIHFVHDAGELGKYNLPQIHGSGVALFDFNGDGLLDIYLLTHGGPTSLSTNRLYRN